jgi:DNA-3-methyladenine glycosylase II
VTAPQVRTGAALTRRDARAAAIRRDAAVLAASDSTLARAAAVAGDFALPLRSPGFATMTWLILGQQVSIEAAEAMFTGLETTLGTVTPAGLLGLGDAALRRCGFTRQKAGYARELAGTLLAGGVSLEEVDALADAEVVAALTRLRGIGEWTAESYLIWALGRRDVFPAGDLALRLGWQGLAGLFDLPSPGALRAVAASWAPRRTAASFLIWHHYLGERGRGSAAAQHHAPVGGDEADGGEGTTERGALADWCEVAEAAGEAGHCRGDRSESVGFRDEGEQAAPASLHEGAQAAVEEHHIGPRRS